MTKATAMSLPVKVKMLRPGARLPLYASEFSAGADLFACLEREVSIQPGASAFIPTGLALEFPDGYAGLVYARSGLSCKSGLAPANKVGVIDSDYRGEITVCLHNHSDGPRTVKNGDRIAQLIFAAAPRAEFTEAGTLGGTARSTGGFGSTGR